MKKFVVLSLISLTLASFAQNELFEQTTLEGIDKAAQPRYLNTGRYYFAKKLMGKDISNMSYDDFKKIYDEAYVEFLKAKNLKENKKTKYNQLVMAVLTTNKFKKYQKDVIEKESDNIVVKGSYPATVPAECYGNVKAYKKALVESMQYVTNVYVASKALKKYLELSKDLKQEEVIEDLKFMKRYIYPKINVNNQWKQIAVDIELNIRANQ